MMISKTGNDHIVWNLQVIPTDQNLAKGNRV